MYGGINLRNTLVRNDRGPMRRSTSRPMRRNCWKNGDPRPPNRMKPNSRSACWNCEELYEAGGENLIIVGTDEPVYTTLLPGFAFHRELLAMVLRRPAQRGRAEGRDHQRRQGTGGDDRLGSIRQANSLTSCIARGDPLDDIKAARNVQLVIKAGVIYDPEACSISRGQDRPGRPARSCRLGTARRTAEKRPGPVH